MHPGAAALLPNNSWLVLTGASCNVTDMTVLTGSRSWLDHKGHGRSCIAGAICAGASSNWRTTAVVDRRGCSPADRTALRHRSHGPRPIAGHPFGRAQGAFAAYRRRVEAVVRETAIYDIERLDARRGHPLRAQSLAGTDPLPR